MRNKLIAPVVKWVGGKRQLLNDIHQLLPKKYSYYCEPFVGGGALLFFLQHKRCVINDSNSELIGVYETIRNSIDLLINDLKNIKILLNIFIHLEISIGIKKNIDICLK